MSDKTTSLQPAFSRILIILTLLCAGVSIFLQAKWYIPVYDDSSYQYVLGEHPIGTVDNDYSRKVETLDDLIESQTNHYLYTNGRAVVHTIVQAVLAFGGWELVPWILSLMMIGTLIALIFYCYPGKMRENPLPWVLAAVVWLMMFPSPDGAFWRFIFAMNYLYPMLLCLVFFMIFRRLREGKRCHVAIAAIVAFLTGWSQEGFSVPLSGAMLIYLIVRWNKVNRNMIITVIALWLGTLLLLVAPGNFVKVTNLRVTTFEGIRNVAMDWFNLMLLWVPLFWVEVTVCAAAFVADRKRSLLLVKEYDILWITFISTLLFSIVGHTTARSLMNVEFLGAVAAFTLLPVIIQRFRISSKAVIRSSALILLLLICHQIFLLVSVRKMSHLQNREIADYKESADGVVVAPVMSAPTLVSPWIFDWHTDATAKSIYFTLTNDYGSRHKPMTPYRERDFKAVKMPDEFFIEANRVEGNSPFYSGDEYLWARLSETEGEKYETILSPVKISECPYLYLKLKASLAPGSFTDREVINVTDTVVTVTDTLVRAPKPWRNVTEIRRID